MWMVGGYNEASHHHHHHHHHHHQVNLDGFNGRKLRPLIPRPAAAVVTSAASCASSAATHSCNFGLYSTAVGGEQGINHKNVINNNNFKEEVNNINNGGGGGVMSTSRWNPTAEQLRMLEDLYRRGTRTPSTDQIQSITAQLRRYGKIEGKNVFYWFQNHKARERQKRRRELQLLSSSSSSHHLPIHPHHADASTDEPIPILGIGNARKQIFTGPANGKNGFDAEQTRTLYAAEESGVMSMQRVAAEKAGRRAVSEHRSSSSSRTNSININNNINSIGSSAVACLFQLDDERNARWHNLAPSSSSSPFTCITTTSTIPTTTTIDYGVAFKTRRFVASLRELVPETTSTGGEEEELYEDDEDGETLQLFPLRSHVDGDQQEDDQDKSKERDVHFFEFLPPKIN